MHRIDPMKRERATAVLVDFCHTKLRFQEKKIFWALPWENLRLLMWPKNPISSYFGQNSEMQNCQDYTDPTVPNYNKVLKPHMVLRMRGDIQYENSKDCQQCTALYFLNKTTFYFIRVGNHLPRSLGTPLDL